MTVRASNALIFVRSIAWIVTNTAIRVGRVIVLYPMRTKSPSRGTARRVGRPRIGVASGAINAVSGASLFGTKSRVHGRVFIILFLESRLTVVGSRLTTSTR